MKVVSMVVKSSSYPEETITYLGGDTAGILVTALLASLLAYLTVVKASKREFREIRLLLVITSIPLLFTFGSILVIESLETLEFI